jgi:hypothetical protein
MTPPSSCEIQYATASGSAMRRVATNPAVIAGLKWPPEMWPRLDTMSPIARPFASATATMSLPLMMPAPPPMKMSVKVPTNSATQRLPSSRFTRETLGSRSDGSER